MNKNLKCLISAGPTREWIDSVRFISNPSSGKMGYALASEAKKRGYSVVLVSGPVQLDKIEGISTHFVENAKEMELEMNNHFDSANIIIMCAAVSDHRPRNKKGGKIKKNDFAKSIDLVENPDILKGLGKRKKKGQLLVGFAAEAENFVQNAKQKLIQKNLDWIAMNDISNASHGFGSDHNEIFLYSSTGEEVKLNSAPKNLLAKQILEEILK